MGLSGNGFWKQFQKIGFENCSLIFIEQKFIWKPKIFLTFFNILKYVLKIIFIYSVLFLIILHVTCIIIS